MTKHVSLPALWGSITQITSATSIRQRWLDHYNATRCEYKKRLESYSPEFRRRWKRLIIRLDGAHEAILAHKRAKWWLDQAADAPYSTPVEDIMLHREMANVWGEHDRVVSDLHGFPTLQPGRHWRCPSLIAGAYAARLTLYYDHIAMHDMLRNSNNLDMATQTRLAWVQIVAAYTDAAFWQLAASLIISKPACILDLAKDA